MKTTLFLAVAITVATASPTGQYHQEYNYKTSSASFKNNELQHKTDDQGYYSKDGDFEGRVKPRVSSNSEHSEYVNPKARDYGSAGYYDGNADLTSHGNLLANSYGASVGGQISTGYQAGNQGYAGSRYSDLESEGLASSNYITGNQYSGSSFQSGSESSYQSANLQTIASRLQNDLRSELEAALRQAQHYDASVLEAELHRNLTARLNEILHERFGSQTIRGGESYSLVEGRLESRPNYDQRELEQLQRQVERTLLDTLRREQAYRSSHSSQQSISNYEHYEATTTYRPTVTYRAPVTYRPIYPNLNAIGPQERYPSSQYGTSQYSEFQSNRQVELTQVPNVVSITTIATNVQNNLNNELNRLLENAQRQYFSENSRYSAVNTDEVLARLKQQLRQNLTYSLDEELRRHFGTQYQKNGHMFSTGSTSQYNYNAADLESLKQQVENNLLSKLTRDFERARQHWITTQQRFESHQTSQGQSQFSDYNAGASNIQRYQYTTPRYEPGYYQPTAASIVPLISQGIKGGHQQFGHSAQSQFGSYGSSSNIAQLERQLQTDLESQLQAALSQNQAHLGRYSSSSSARGQAGFDEAYRRLSEELQRNLTQQLQSFVSGSSGYSSSYGSVNENQLAQLRSQLQNSLSSQLQQGLQQSYSASSSFSASSGSSASAGAGAYSSSSSGDSYRGTRGSDNSYDLFGQYRSGGSYLAGADDCQDDERRFRGKRSYGYRSQPLGISSHAGVGYNARGGTYGGASGYGQYQPVGQETDDSELIQSSQFPKVNPENIGQEIDDDDTQQIQIDPQFGQFPVSANQQQQEDLDDTQQVQVDHGFSSLGLGSQNVQAGYPGRTRPIQGYRQSQLEAVRQPSLDQQSQPIVGVQNGNLVGQEEDDWDDTQQVQVDHGFGSVGLGSQNAQAGYPGRARPVQSSNQHQLEAVYQTPLRQLPQPEVGGQAGRNTDLRGQSGIHIGQEEDDSEDTQQVQVAHGFGSIGVGSQRVETGYLGRPLSTQGTNQNQLTTNINQKPLSQVREPIVGGIGSPVQNGLQLDAQKDDLDDTQQIENVDFATGQAANHNLDNSNNRERATEPNVSGFGSTGGIQGINSHMGGEFESSHSYSHHRSEVQQHQYNHQTNYYSKPVYLGRTPQYDVINPAGRDQRGNQNVPNVDFQQVETFDTTKPLVGADIIDNKREITTPRAFSLTTSSNTPLLSLGQDNVGQEIDAFQQTESNGFSNQFSIVSPSSPRSNPIGASFHSGTTPRSLLVTQFGTQNELPDSETVLPLPNSFGGVSYLPRPQSQPHILQVKLENITPEQFNIISQIEDDFSGFLDVAVQNEYPSRRTVSETKYHQYQASLVKLERELRRNLTDCFAGTIKANSELARLNKYSNLVYSKFDFRTISDVKKYIEIKLIKKLRVQLKKVFNIEEGSLASTAATVPPYLYSTPVQSFPRKPLTAESSFNVPIQPEAPAASQFRPLIPPQKSGTENAGFVSGTTGTNVQYLSSNSQSSTPIANAEPGIPPQLQAISANIENALTLQIDDIIRNELPSSWFPSQVYSKTLNLIRENITKECQKLLADKTYAYLNVQQKDVTALEQYIETHVSKTLTEKFKNSGYYEDSFNFQSVAPPRGTQYNGLGGSGYVQVPAKPQTSPKTFLEDEINSQARQFEFVPFKKSPSIESDSLVTSTKSSLFDAARPLPEPTLSSSFPPSSSEPNNSDRNVLLDAENDADQLIALVKNLTRKTQENSNSNTQYVQVKLENITPEQLNLINEIESGFHQVITEAVASEYSSAISRNDEASNYRLYEASRIKLEEDLRRKLSDCFEGRINKQSKFENLNKYSNLIQRKFEFHKIADVQKYLEIKLIRQLRYMLKELYHIVESDSGLVGSQPSAGQEDRRVVKLENITPEQLQLIRKIEDDVGREIEAVIQRRVISLRQSQLSHFAYHQSLVTLEQEMINKITEILERYCEPGFPQYAEVISTGFEPSNIYELKRYLQIRLDKKVREIIEVSSRSPSTVSVGTPTHHSIGTYSGSNGYGSTSNQEWQSQGGYHGSSTSLNQRGVKGGRHGYQGASDLDAEYIRRQSNAAVEQVPEEAPISPEIPEATTPTPGWWTRFGNKVKKIVGKS